MASTDAGRTLLLSIDFEDWHQLVRRRVGVREWQEPGPALGRQTERILSLLDELGVRATFFILGMAARAHPGLVQQVVAAGHEVGCHGDAHLPVAAQTRQQFASDLRRALTTIEELTGKRPAGYRAPAFSITEDTPWAYEVLAASGFVYDSSQHDSPRIRHQSLRSRGRPHTIELPDGQLWEFPIAVWRTRRFRIPVGGASYWSAIPTTLILRGLHEAGPMAGLYLHPYELDPETLRARLPSSARLAQRGHGVLRAGQRNFARRRAADVLREVASRYRLITYGEAHAQLDGGTSARP